LNAAFALRGLTSGALVGGLILAVTWRRTGAVPVIAGMVASLGVMTAVEVLPALPATRDWWMSLIGTAIFWPWYTLIGSLVTLAVAALAHALLSRQH
jgi:solute:Na+ symporter, SSS family